MAIGLFGGNAKRSSSSDDDKNIKNEKDAELGRIEDPSRRDMDTDSDRFSVGKQMELEAENAIKYRTCSWQKACNPLF